MRTGPARSSAGKYRYQQVAARLTLDIRGGFKPGDRFHSEPELCRRLKVTRNTVRKAIDILVSEGLLEKRGRAGNYVADFHNKGFDDRLFCVAMPIRVHLWDQVFLSLSHASIQHERYALICDMTGYSVESPFSEVLPIAASAERLRATLSFRPRTLVLSNSDVLRHIGEQRHQFRNLILLTGELHPGYDHIGSVCADVNKAWELMARHAMQVGYTRFCFALPTATTNLEEIRRIVEEASDGVFERSQQLVLFQHQAEWPARAVELARDSGGPIAFGSNYDWGAKQVRDELRKVDISIPDAVGLYGMNNTPWSMQDDLTTMLFDPNDWAAAIFDVDDELDRGGQQIMRKVAPTIVERGSTRHL